MSDAPRPTPWTEPADFEAFRTAAETGFIFKHSTRCPVSSWADQEVQDFVASHPDVPVFRVLVVESRPVSRAIADALGVPHASPQAILVRDGAAVWNASHDGVTADALAEAWNASSPV